VACRSTVAARSRAIPASETVRLTHGNHIRPEPRASRPFRIFRGGLAVFVLAASAVPALGGCDRGPSEVREWTVDDHDQPPSAAGQVTARPGTEGVDPSLIDLAWRRNCATCHGAAGRGDGPQGPMVRAPDLTREEWQANISDDEMATIIRKGKNKMPAFDLPDQVVQGLVQRIRAARAK
jgi:mono/diheme cytochrome c family protein